MLLWYTIWQGIDGSRVEKVLESVHIAANKNTVPGDVSAMVPGGIRMGTVSINDLFYMHIGGSIIARWLRLCFHDSGTPALTSRGFVEDDFKKVAEYFDVAVKIALQIKENAKGGPNTPAS